MMAVAKRSIHYILNKSENVSSELTAIYLQNETSQKSNASVSECSKTGLLQTFNKSLNFFRLLAHKNSTFKNLVLAVSVPFIG